MLKKKIVDLIIAYNKLLPQIEPDDPNPIEVLAGQLEELYFKYENDQVKLSIEEQKKEFKVFLEPYLGKYSADLLNKFYRYWTAHDPKGKKVRWLLVKAKSKVFDLPGRLATFARMEKENEEKQRLVSKHAWLGK